jgi:arylformamidase
MSVNQFSVIDLTLPIRHHFRWEVDIDHLEAFERGDDFQTSKVAMSCHAFTHVDAPAHFVKGGKTVDQISPGEWSGNAAIVDLSELGPMRGIAVDDLEQRDVQGRSEDIFLLKTCWDNKVDVNSSEFWLQAPYLTRPAAEFLRAEAPRCVGFDFPQDFCIREMLQGNAPRREDFVTHDVLLRNGVVMIEYLAGLEQLKGDTVLIVVAPLKLDKSDGAPARVFALDFVGNMEDEG